MDFSFLLSAAILKETDGRKHLEENIVRLRKDQKGLLQGGLSAKTIQVRGLFSQLKSKGGLPLDSAFITELPPPSSRTAAQGQLLPYGATRAAHQQLL